ncbi:HdeD family acid-resistance protein [Anaerovorax odorimutans]|nr:HdeD family acid-resistance protein [Anaerovorax odorimutans]
MRVLTIISGILLVLTGVFCFANPGETFLSLAFVLGLIMVINSIIQGIAYCWGRSGQNDNNGWILTEAIITFILGILILSNQIAADVAIPMVFGMWAMFSGVLRVVTATMIDRAHKKLNFAWTLITGVLCALGGIYAFLNPIIAGLAIAVLLGIMFMLQGISTLELGIHMPHEKKVKKPKTKKDKRAKKKQQAKEAAEVIDDYSNKSDEPDSPVKAGEFSVQQIAEENSTPAAEPVQEMAQPAMTSGVEPTEKKAAEPDTAVSQEKENADNAPVDPVQEEEDRIAAAIRQAEEAQIAAALKKAASIKNSADVKDDDRPDFSNIFKD